MSHSPKKEYHYELMQQNRARVREQGTAINKELKRLRSISDPQIRVVRDDEITQQHVTLPPTDAGERKLQAALEEAEAKASLTPPEPKTRKWYRWTD